jgi:hypothetical protein
LIGEGVARFRALTDTKQQVTLLGMAWWGNIAERARTMVLELQKEVSNIIVMILYKRTNIFLRTQ